MIPPTPPKGVTDYGGDCFEDYEIFFLSPAEVI